MICRQRRHLFPLENYKQAWRKCLIKFIFVHLRTAGSVLYRTRTKITFNRQRSSILSLIPLSQSCITAKLYCRTSNYIVNWLFLRYRLNTYVISTVSIFTTAGKICHQWEAFSPAQFKGRWYAFGNCHIRAHRSASTEAAAATLNI